LKAVEPLSSTYTFNLCRVWTTTNATTNHSGSSHKILSRLV